MAKKTLFIHADIKKQVNGQGGNKTFLWRYLPSAYFLLENMLIKQFSYVLSCNSESLKYLQKTYFSTKGCYQLIRNTVDDEIFFPLSAQLKDQKRLQLISEMELSLKTRFITYVGRLHPQKDPLLLVRSVAELDDANIHLLMIGVGELKEDIQLEIKNLGLNSQVTLLGSMNSREIADILRVSDLLALTSVYEGLPMVVLEALTCGIPIVSTDSGETSKLLTKKQESSFLREPLNPPLILSGLYWKTLNVIPVKPALNYPVPIGQGWLFQKFITICENDGKTDSNCQRKLSRQHN